MQVRLVFDSPTVVLAVHLNRIRLYNDNVAFNLSGASEAVASPSRMYVGYTLPPPTPSLARSKR